MISIRSAEISWWTGISIVTEEDKDYKERISEERASLRRRYEMVREIAVLPEIRKDPGPASASIWSFLIDSSNELIKFDPNSIPRRRWLVISGYSIPLRPIKSYLKTHNKVGL